MAGEDVGIKEYLERILSERDERYEQRFLAQEKATDRAVATTREALALTLTASKESSAATVEANRILALKAEEFADQKLETHNAIKPWVQSIVDGQTSRVEALERRVARFENREEGMSLTSKVVLGGVGFLATLAGLAATIIGLYFAFVQ